MGPTWVLSASDGPNIGTMNLAIRGHFDRICNRYPKASILTPCHQYCLHKFIISYIFVIDVLNVSICGVSNMLVNCHIRQWDDTVCSVLIKLESVEKWILFHKHFHDRIDFPLKCNNMFSVVFFGNCRLQLWIGAAMQYIVSCVNSLATGRYDVIR